MQISGKKAFNGEIRVPGDKSISHRALLISALSSGTSRISGLSAGLDVRATRSVIAQLGAEVIDEGDVIRVVGGVDRLSPPKSILDVGNSGTLIRLGAGLVAGLGGSYTFSGDESVNRRPMRRIFVPLVEMGARIDAANDGETAPFTITSNGLHGISYEMPVASAQVKSAILLAGLGADGVTTVVERTPTRRHSEEMLLDAGADIEFQELGDRTEIKVRRSRLKPLEYDIPGDPSQAAFWIVGALITPNSEVEVANIYLGELRSDFISVLKRMGGNITVSRLSRNTGNVTVRSSLLHGTEISAPEIPGLIDELPVLAVAAAFADGETLITGASELRVKESDRISTMVAALRSFGADVTELPDGMRVAGGSGLRPGHVFAHLDHRVAMACSIMAAGVEGETEIHGFSSVESSYPDFLRDFKVLTRLGNVSR